MRLIQLAVAGLLSLLVLGPACAQQVLSLDSVLAGSLRVSPLLRQSAEERREQAALLRGSFSLANPSLTVESPTGEFFTLGAQQTFEFPTVYTRQAKVGRAQVELAGRSLALSLAAVRRDARLAYLALQVAEARQQQLAAQDSLLRTLAAASERLFAAGEVDYLQRVSTAAESRQAGNRVQQAAADRRAAQRRLGLLLGRPTADLATGTNLADPANLLRQAPLALTAAADTAQLRSSPQWAFYSQSIEVGRQNLRLARARNLPGLSLGYINQGPRETPQLYRLQAGLTLPLYFFLNRSRTQAAEARLRAATAQRDAAALEQSSQYQQALADVRKFGASLRYYQETGLPQAGTIISTAQRLFQAGEVSYYLFVQSVSQAFQIRSDYLDAVRGYQEALIQLHYLQGQ
jgi:cobalt-zinc-cadmium efflux system outer membrane protein